ncbi:hypothetical protein [Neosynechococcus sphagnicola]|uniref:hypothetical protein n=1 Tax=Neosynechococcus sphagnicola TaxID=1501145 RepID=UPI00056012E8|nr:hypothetical protein [Neosynechococcus sphagnicola]
MSFSTLQPVVPLGDGQSFQAEFKSQTGTWVKLRDLPTPYSFDEAFLLCEVLGGSWVAWVPDCGEVLLQPREFYRLP